MSRQYFPSNGSEGEIFMENYCFYCYKYKTCTILDGALIDGKEPKQWIYNDDGRPTCTSFKSAEERNRERKRVVKEDKNQMKLF